MVVPSNGRPGSPYSSHPETPYSLQPATPYLSLDEKEVKEEDSYHGSTIKAAPLKIPLLKHAETFHIPQTRAFSIFKRWNSAEIEPAKIMSVTELAEVDCRGSLSRSAILVGLYLLLGVVIGNFQGWQAVDSLYFSVTTLTTVGYGDFSLGSDSCWMKLLGAAFILLGLIVVANALSVVFEYVLSRGLSAAQRKTAPDTFQPPESEERRPRCRSRSAFERRLSRSGTLTGSDERAQLFKESKDLYQDAQDTLKADLIVAVLKVGAVVLGGALIVGFIEGWDLCTSIYWSAATAATVGYGDISPKTVAGRLVATAMMLTGVILAGKTAGFVATYSTLMHEVRSRQQVLLQFGTNLTPEKFRALTQGKEVVELGLCSSQDDMTQAEFCLFMLFHMGRISKEELQACQNAFECLDITHTGKLSRQDVDIHSAVNTRIENKMKIRGASMSA